MQCKPGSHGDGRGCQLAKSRIDLEVDRPVDLHIAVVGGDAARFNGVRQAPSSYSGRERARTAGDAVRPVIVIGGGVTSFLAKPADCIEVDGTPIGRGDGARDPAQYATAIVGGETLSTGRVGSVVGRVRRPTVITAGSDAQSEGPAADVRPLHRPRRGARTSGHEAPHAGPRILPEPDDPPVEYERVSEDSRAQQSDGSTNEEPTQHFLSM